MILSIPRDMFDNPTPPQILLCQTDKEIIGELPAYSRSLDGKWNTYSEMSFTIDRYYIDMITGETKVHPLFDKVEGLRKVLVKGFGYWEIQDPDSVYSDSETKTVNCFESSYETGQKYLENFYINTGNEDSKEVIYHTDQLGADYFSKDTLYKVATVWDEFERYYVKEYNSDASYVYTQTTVIDENDFNTFDETLYVKSYPNVRFYWPSKPELSLLHLVFKRIPAWKIGHVDADLRDQERKFEEQRISVYDFLQSKVADTFKCVVEWDTLTNTVNFYEEAEDGIEEDNSVATRWDTDVFISRDNLANEIKVKYSSDNIKTKLKVSGGDSLSISEVNLGQDYIINLNYYHTVDWMGQDLYLRYHDYMKVVEENTSKYEEAAKSRQGAYNLWQDMYYNIPIDKGVLLVGDQFTQLYCIYDTVNALKKWLDIYGVKKDTKATTSDNVLFTLKDEGGNSVTIRVYFDETEKTYLIKRTLVNASTGGSVPITYTLEEWVNNELTSEQMGLSDYTVTSIGTLGAYLCLTVDESDPENPTLQEYGVMLLKEKQQVYTKIFVTQTERAMSQEDAVCVASDTEPEGELADGTKWLDTSDSDMLILKEYRQISDNWHIIEIASTEQPEGYDWENGTRWLDTNGSVDINETIVYVYSTKTRSWTKSNSTSDVLKGLDYTVYLENFAKLTAVEKVLAEKEKLAEFYSNGIAIQGRYITEPSKTLLKDAAEQYFGNLPIDYPSSADSYDETLALYTFTITGDENKYAVYLRNSIPYVAYLTSTAVWQLKMDYYKSITNMETFFTEDEWMKLSPFIREDEFTDDNFALTGYESEEERSDICKQLLTNAQKELKTLSQPSLEFSMTMANILALPEFEGIKNQFKLGSFIRVGVRPDYVKRSRLLEVHINFDDISDFSADFGNLITTKSEIDKHSELLSQAIQAGKTVASSASSWQRAVNKSNNIDKAIEEGLKEATLEIGSTNGQNIEIGQYGIWGRKLIEGTTDQYEDEQFRIINNKILFSDDAFATSRAVFGKFSYNGNEHYGVICDALIGGYMAGSTMEGGTIRIGEQSDGTYAFEVKEDGTVTMGGGSTIGGTTVDEILNAALNSGDATIYTSRPSTYKIGDLWILADDEVCGAFGTGNILKAIESSDSAMIAYYPSEIASETSTLDVIYSDEECTATIDTSILTNSDVFIVQGRYYIFDAENTLYECVTVITSHWIDAVEDITTVISNVKESFTWDDSGIQVAKKVTTGNGVSTPFYVHIDSERMGFHSQTIDNSIVKDVEVVHIGNNSAIIQNATFEGSDGTIFNNDVQINEDANFYGSVNIYNESKDGFAWQVEDDGSLSLMVIS